MRIILHIGFQLLNVTGWDGIDAVTRCSQVLIGIT